MAPKKNNSYRDAFDAIVFLGFVALLSVAATMAGGWEQRMCEPKPGVGKTLVKTDVLESKVVLSSRRN